MRYRVIEKVISRTLYIIEDMQWNVEMKGVVSGNKEYVDEICRVLNSNFSRSKQEVHAKTESQSSEEKA